MMRRKIETKRIENPMKNYLKRKQCLFRKAKEINVLCDAEVSVVIVHSPTKMIEFCSPNTTYV